MSITVNNPINWVGKKLLSIVYKILGNTTVYGSASSPVIYRVAVPFTMTETGTIHSISLYHSAGSQNTIWGIYSDAAGPKTLLASTPSTTVSSSLGWQTIDLTTPVEVTSGQKIWLALVFQNTSITVRYIAGSTPRAITTVGWAGGMPADFGSFTTANFSWSIYCTYSIVKY